MTDRLNKRLDHLINNLKAYKDYDAKGKGLRHAVKAQLHWWDKRQEGMEVIRVPILYKDLWKEVQTGRRAYMEEALAQDWRTFQVLESSEKHLRIEDKRKQLLVYRFRLPEKLTQTLVDTEYLIPPDKSKTHERGTTINRHWGMWKKYMPKPRMTSEYRRDLPYSQQWFDANHDLFKYLSDALRLLEPKMYVRFNSIRKFLPEGTHPTCGAWYACAINQNMTEDGTPHLDLSDYYCGLNVVTGWGTFTSAKLLLWQLGLAIEVKPGDAIMFLGRVFTHNAVDIQGGVRNIVDAFAHQGPLMWKDKKHKEKTGFGRKGPLGEAGDLVGKGKGKQKQVEPDVEMEDVEEQVEVEERVDTDYEMEVMYTAGDMEDEDEGEVMLD